MTSNTLLATELERTRYQLAEGATARMAALGVVVDVVHTGTQERRRMLLIHADAAGAAALARNIRTSARRLTRFTHPNVARVLDFGATSAGRPFLVSEAVTGISLAAWLEQRAFLPAVDTLQLMKAVLSALEQLHQSGLSHGWLGAEHIHFDNETLTHPKLTDFGVPALLADETLDDAAIRRDLLAVGQVLKRAMSAAAPLRPFTDITRAVVEQASADAEDQRFEHASKLREALEVALLREEIALAEADAPAAPAPAEPAPAEPARAAPTPDEPAAAALADVALLPEVAGASAMPLLAPSNPPSSSPPSAPPKAIQPRSLRPAPPSLPRVSAGWIVLGMVVLAAIVALILQLSGLLE